MWSAMFADTNDNSDLNKQTWNANERFENINQKGGWSEKIISSAAMGNILFLVLFKRVPNGKRTSMCWYKMNISVVGVNQSLRP